jgi:UDP-3-O-[3-hydroxymyristoyl] glucosamine N-acyltransferase
MLFTAAQIATQLQGQVFGDGGTVLSGFAPAENARQGDLTFAENEVYFGRAETSSASAILVAGDFASKKKVLIKVANARVAFAKVLPLFFPEPVLAAGIHPTVIVAPAAEIHPTAHLGPYCVIGDRVRIGARTVLRGNNHVDADCQLGEDVHLFPGATLYARTRIGDRVRIHAGSVIGGDGFGYVIDQGIHRKVPQVGCVIIGDDVEIGANVTVDRGALGPTLIGRGTKIDNLVQIGHNVSIGDHCLVVAQVGIAGSTKLGDYVVLGGQVGIVGHLKIGHRATITAQSGIAHDVKDGERMTGSPANPAARANRQIVALRQLPRLIQRVRKLEKELGLKPAAEEQAPD